MARTKTKTLDSMLETTLTQRGNYETLNQKLTFTEYLEKVQDNPILARNAYQRMYDMIMSYSVHYKIFYMPIFSLNICCFVYFQFF